MSTEAQLLNDQMHGMQEDMAMANLPRAISLVSHQDTLYKLYTDGTVFWWETGKNEWLKEDDDNYLKEKTEEILKGLANS